MLRLNSLLSFVACSPESARTQVQTHADVLYAMGLLDEVQRHHARRMQQRVVRYLDARHYDLAHRAREELLDYIEVCVCVCVCVVCSLSLSWA